jgi:hypothetical protein
MYELIKDKTKALMLSDLLLERVKACSSNTQITFGLNSISFPKISYKIPSTTMHANNKRQRDY